MAAASPKVSARLEADRSVSLGVTLEGTFVPFVSMSGARIGQLLENERDRAGTTRTDDDSEGSDES